MGLEHLLEALERDANAQIERLQAEARAEADRLTATATEALERQRREAREERERSRHQEVEHAVTLARRRARRSVLEARERLLERVFAAARAELPAAVTSDAYRATLPAALAGALSAVGNAPAIIRCSNTLSRELQRLMPAGRASVTVESGVGSGFRLTTADGAVEVDDTLEVRLDRLRPLLARRVLARLELDT